MSDSSSLLPNQTGLPSDLNFNLKPSGVRARNYRASILPTNKSSFNPGELCVLYVPGGRRNTYLDTSQTYVRYTIQNTDTTASTSGQLLNGFFLDNTGACVINRLDVYHASNLLETVQQYNVLMNYITDVNMTPSQKLGLSSAYGTSGQNSIATATTSAWNTDVSRQGAYLRGKDYISSTDTAVNQQITICMPILSGVLGLGSDKYLPIGKLSDDIRIEITMESLANAVVFTNALSSGALPSTAGWIVKDVQLELSITELSDEGEQMVNSMISPEHPIYLHHNSWRHYSSLFTAASGTIALLVPARFGSLKSLVLCPRSNAFQSPGAYTLSSRTNPNFAQYYWRIGSNLMPPKYVTLENDGNTGGYGESFMEMQKCWHSVSSAANASNLAFPVYNVADNALSSGTGIGAAISTGKALSPVLINQTTLAVGTSATSRTLLSGTTYLNGFVIAQEMESYALRSDVLLSGYNTLSQQIFFEAQINNTPSNNYTFNFYANYDGIIVLENGIMSVRF